MAQQILTQHSIFKGEILSMFKQKVSGRDFDSILKEFEKDNVDKESLRKNGQYIIQEHKRIVNQYCAGESSLSKTAIDDVKGAIQRKLAQAKSNIESIGKRTESLEKLMVQLLPHLFALYTLLLSAHYF